jgi:hypothetical protein
MLRAVASWVLAGPRAAVTARVIRDGGLGNSCGTDSTLPVAVFLTERVTGIEPA